MSRDPEPLEQTKDAQPLKETPSVEVQRAQAERLLRAWKTPTGWRYWSSVNNTEVGLWYTAMTLFFLLFGGVLALLMRPLRSGAPSSQVLTSLSGKSELRS